MAIIIDPIADMFVRIKNAIARKYHEVNVPSSKENENLRNFQKRRLHHWFWRIQKSKNHDFKEIKITLKYKGINQNQSAISGLKRISKPGLKVYSPATSLPKVLSGYGTVIVSTSKGLLTDKEARKANVGGEVLAFIW